MTHLYTHAGLVLTALSCALPALLEEPPQDAIVPREARVIEPVGRYGRKQ